MNTNLRLHRTILIGSLSTLFVACGTTSPLHFSQALVGRVTDRAAEADTQQSSLAAVPIVVGGGALVMGAVPHTRGTPAHFIYTIKPEGDGSSFAIVASVAELRVGDCVAVLTDPHSKEDRFWSLGRATVRASDKCR